MLDVLVYSNQWCYIKHRLDCVTCFCSLDKREPLLYGQCDSVAPCFFVYANSVHVFNVQLGSGLTCKFHYKYMMVEKV